MVDTTDRAVILEQVIALVNEVHEGCCSEPRAPITEQSNFVTDLQLDSLACIELAMLVEEELHILLPDEDMVGLATVELLTDYVINHINTAKLKEV